MKIDLKPIFKGQTVYVVGSGESLLEFDFELLRGKNVIAINDMIFRKIPFAQVLVAMDPGWFKRNKKELENFKGIRLTRCGKGRPEWNYFIDEGKSEDLCALRKTGNSGFYALAAALKLGASKVYLLGFDITWKKQPYCYDSTREEIREYKRSMHFKDAHLRYFEYYKDFNIINASPDSAITCFPKCELTEIF
ncbi:hypothetical protein ES703_44272 [subsurface metagenome]